MAYFAALCASLVPVVNEVILRYRLATYDFFPFEVSPWDVPVWFVQTAQGDLIGACGVTDTQDQHGRSSCLERSRTARLGSGSWNRRKNGWRPGLSLATERRGWDRRAPRRRP